MKPGLLRSGAEDSAPETLVLRFLPGTSKLTPESEAELLKLIEMPGPARVAKFWW